MKRTDHARPWRLLSLLLVVFMLASAFPMAAFAESAEGTESAEDNGLEVLLKMDYLSKDAVTTNAGEYKVTDWAVEAKRGTGGEILASKDAVKSGLVGVDTDLPVNASTRYVITFSVKKSEVANTNKLGTVFGLAAEWHNSASYMIGVHGVFYPDGNKFTVASKWTSANVYYKGYSSSYGPTDYTAGSKNYWNDYKDADGYIDVTMTLIGSVVTYYVGSVVLGCYDIGRISGERPTSGGQISAFNRYSVLRLCGGTSHSIGGNAGSKNGDVLTTIKDITVYSADLPENTKLLSMSTLSANRDVSGVATVGSYGVNHHSASGHNSNSSGVFGTESAGIYTNGGRTDYYSSYGAVAVNTNLYLNETSKYSITYSMKKGQADSETGLWTYFGLASAIDYAYKGSDNKVVAENISLLNGAHMAISPDGTKVGLHHGYWTTGVYGKADDKTDCGITELNFSVWDRADADGYVPFMITIDQYVMSLYCNGEKIASYDLYAFDETQKGTGKYHDPSAANRYCSVALVAGFHDPATEKATTWEMKGDALTYYQENQVKDLDKSVPMLYCKDISVYSGILSKSNDSEIVGWQDTVNEDNVNKTRKMRIIGGIYDLTGDNIGFDVLVEYKDADGNAQQKKFRRMSKNALVYTSILAGGETVTAASKGVNYLFEIVIDDIPSDVTDLQFTVAPFKLIGEERVFGQKKIFTMEMNQK